MQDESMEINVIVIPNSKAAMVVKVDNRNYRVKVNAPPKEGRANVRLVEILAEHFGVPKSSVRVLKGYGSRNKVVGIFGI